MLRGSIFSYKQRLTGMFNSEAGDSDGGEEQRRPGSEVPLSSERLVWLLSESVMELGG